LLLLPVVVATFSWSIDHGDSENHGKYIFPPYLRCLRSWFGARSPNSKACRICMNTWRMPWHGMHDLQERWTHTLHTAGPERIEIDRDGGAVQRCDAFKWLGMKEENDMGQERGPPIQKESYDRGHCCAGRARTSIVQCSSGGVV